jgi:hypothetical protein
MLVSDGRNRFSDSVESAASRISVSSRGDESAAGFTQERR